MELLEQVVDTQDIYDGYIVHLRVDTVRLPDGRESKREIVVHRGAVCIVAITDEQDVLMVRQFRLAAGQGAAGDPGGYAGGRGGAACMRGARAGRGDRLLGEANRAAVLRVPGARILYRTDPFLSGDGVIQGGSKSPRWTPMKTSTWNAFHWQKSNAWLPLENFKTPNP